MHLFKTLITLGLTFIGSQASIAQSKEVYKSEDLSVLQVTATTFIHRSYLMTESYGKVASNGLIYVNNNEVIIFDTPTNDSASYELIHWVEDRMQGKIKAVVVGHFHEDCLGGLKTFHKAGIESYANELTIELAKENSMTIPKKGFSKQQKLRIGKNDVICRFFGPGHTSDNIIGYIPDEKVLFGGCLIKSLKSGKGYLGDANVNEWANTVSKIKKEYPEVEYVIPGHGSYGDADLLDYTIKMFEKNKRPE